MGNPARISTFRRRRTMIRMKRDRDGATASVNSEEVVPKFEELGFRRLTAVEKMKTILWDAVRDWAIPAICAIVMLEIFGPTREGFTIRLVTFYWIQQILRW